MRKLVSYHNEPGTRQQGSHAWNVVNGNMRRSRLLPPGPLLLAGSGDEMRTSHGGCIQKSMVWLDYRWLSSSNEKDQHSSFYYRPIVDLSVLETEENSVN